MDNTGESAMFTALTEKDVNPRMVAFATAFVIRFFPENYDQNFWIHSAADTVGEYLKDPDSYRCGTTACVAGWVNIMTSAPDEVMSEHAFYKNGFQHEYFSDRAARLLGLTGRKRGYAEWLFQGHRTKDEVLKALDLIAAGKSIRNMIPIDYIREYR